MESKRRFEFKKPRKALSKITRNMSALEKKPEKNSKNSILLVNLVPEITILHPGNGQGNRKPQLYPTVITFLSMGLSVIFVNQTFV